MSERKPKYIVKKISADSVDAAKKAGEAPAAEVKPLANSMKPKKKRRKKNRISLRLEAFMMVLTLVFGVVVGYAVGRATGTARLAAAQARIDALTSAAEEAGRQEIDIFTENLSAENRAALADLSGMSMQSGGENNVFLSSDGFSGVSESAETDPVVVAQFNGGELMSDAVSRRYNERLAGYVFSGYTEAEIAEGLLNDVMQEMVMEKLLQLQAQQRGLYELTDADRQQVAAEAQAQYDAQLVNYRSFVYAEGMTDADVNEAAAAFLLEAEGLDVDSIQKNLEADWWQRKLRSSVVGDVRPDASAILAAYNEKLDEQKERFSASSAAFEQAHIDGEVLLYNLSGYRAVRPLLLRLSEEQQQALARGEAVDTVYAPLEAQAREILSAAAGESFGSLLSRYGEDEAMDSVALSGSGYYISADSDLWSKEVVQAAMALTTPGQLSGAIRGSDGVYILEYVGEVQGGEVDMALVYDAMTADAAAAAQEKAWEAQKSAWLAEANVKYYPERMQ